MSLEKKYKMPDAVFWDWDGTLIDSLNLLYQANSHALEILGLPSIQHAEYKQYFGKAREFVYKSIYNDKSEAAKTIVAGYIAENGHETETILGCEDILKFFYKRQIPMGIVSNSPFHVITEDIKRFNWDKYFTTIIGAGDAQEDKPSSAPLLLALERENLSPDTHHIWYIGDTENDLACVAGTGCHAVFLKDSENAEQLIEKYNPLIHFESYAQLKEILVAI